MPARKPKKKNSKFSASRLLFNQKFILILGLLLIGLSIGSDIYKKSLPIFIGYEPQLQEAVEIVPSNPKTLVIPDISVDLDVETSQAKGNVWQISETGVSYLASSATLEQTGNTVIYGHNKKNLLGKLPQLKKGAPIYLTDDSGKTYKFVVSEILTVKPEDVWILTETSEKILTLYTCTGFLDSKRLVIRALPEELYKKRVAMKTLNTLLKQSF